MDFDKVYKEHHEAADSSEIDKQVDDRWAAKEAEMPPKEAPPKEGGKEGSKEASKEAEE